MLQFRPLLSSVPMYTVQVTRTMMNPMLLRGSGAARM
jgi:hypothetical protein